MPLGSQAIVLSGRQEVKGGAFSGSMRLNVFYFVLELMPASRHPATSYLIPDSTSRTIWGPGATKALPGKLVGAHYPVVRLPVSTL